MPNYVYAAFDVSGEKEEIERFRTKMLKRRNASECSDEDEAGRPEIILDFSEVLPMPADWEGGSEEDWNVHAWGTKWVGFDVDEQMCEDGTFWFQFTTAWDFPTRAFEAIAAEFPTLLFSGSAYEENHEFEMAGDFNGETEWGEGELRWIVID
ncbi:hypothetical protein K3177_14695 [Qipengyuania sp. GH25]|uniref:YubB ferredoxin-like domain-containing protein n=1 Tax=Qipengyuania pacifica TaxID=2860199 RepID=A0ABS7JK32_9SPHN|nr:hypothetical protein [Qipengyuania aerophila]MBX7489754.1 hypothetical protein [Qipengyuania aerophila]